MSQASSDVKPSRPLPVATVETEPYWEAAREGVLVIQYCESCGYRQFYPRTLCRQCGSVKLGWMETSGAGTIYTFTVTHRPAGPEFEALTPYVCAVIELDEGVKMLSNVVDCEPTKVRIGQRVQVDFLRLTDEISLPVFKLDDKGVAS